jgi:hypothetical protein
MAKKTTPKKPSTRTPDPNVDDDDDKAGDGEGDGEGDEDGDGEGDTNERNRRLNAMVTGRVKRALGPITAQLAALSAKLDTLGKKPSGGEDTDDDSDDDEQEATPPPSRRGRAEPKESKKLSALERRVRDAEERASKAELAQKEQAEKARRGEEDAAIGGALQKAGITDPRVVKAITLSLRSDEVIVRDEETGKIRFKTVDKWGTEDFVDPDAGIAKWIKAEGKVFLPAVPASGSGAGGATGANTSTGTGLSREARSKLSPVERARIEIERASSGLPPLEP